MKKIFKNIKNKYIQYKNKEYKTIFGKIIQMLICHNLTRMGLFLLLMIIGGILFATFEIGMMIFVIGSIGAGIHVVVGFIYAWIINPIRQRRKQKNNDL